MPKITCITHDCAASAKSTMPGLVMKRSGWSSSMRRAYAAPQTFSTNGRALPRYEMVAMILRRHPYLLGGTHG